MHLGSPGEPSGHTSMVVPPWWKIFSRYCTSSHFRRSGYSHIFRFGWRCESPGEKIGVGVYVCTQGRCSRCEHVDDCWVDDMWSSSICADGRRARPTWLSRRSSRQKLGAFCQQKMHAKREEVMLSRRYLYVPAGGRTEICVRAASKQILLGASIRVENLFFGRRFLHLSCLTPSGIAKATAPVSHQMTR